MCNISRLLTSPKLHIDQEWGKWFYATGLSSRYIPLAEFMKVPSEWKSGLFAGAACRAAFPLCSSTALVIILCLPLQPRDTRTRRRKYENIVRLVSEGLWIVCGNSRFVPRETDINSVLVKKLPLYW